MHSFGVSYRYGLAPCLHYSSGRGKGLQMQAITKTTGTLQQVAQQQDIAALLQRFIDYVDVKEVTVKSYGVCLRAFMEWLGENGIQQPQRSDILAYVDYLAKPHRRRARCDRPQSRPGSTCTYSAGTQARYLRAVKLFFRWTAQEGLYPNVADNIKGAKVKADNTKRDPLQREDAVAVLESIDRSDAAGKRDYAMFWLAFTAGVRIIEIQRANVGNLETIAGERVLFVQGKGHDEADAYKKLSEATYRAIADYLETRGSLDASAPLFASEGNRSRGGRLTEPSISRIFKRRLKAAGYDSSRITAHSMRHSSITFLLEDGATIQQAQHHARHASPETTGIYAHNIDQRKEHSEQRIEDYLLGVEHDTAEQVAEAVKRLDEDQLKHALAILQAMAA